MLVTITNSPKFQWLNITPFISCSHGHSMWMFAVSCVSWATLLQEKAGGLRLLPSCVSMLLQVLGTISVQPADETERSSRNAEKAFHVMPGQKKSLSPPLFSPWPGKFNCKGCSEM